eukprot:TRINITY_DN550_c0_g5_i2.p1 TRINITY_DN550_c0_g5~~TRINITY_DN550_c0_g5_i2.p1  ORF type:complete len:946 (-),score=79.65 TRINITY_DN550_c0_g5_i2:24-2861(-)
MANAAQNDRPGVDSEAVLGIKSFFARSKYRIANGSLSNAGVGRTTLSPSHTIIGRFQRLKSLKHPNLCAYIDILKGKHDRLFVVSEHYTCSLRRLIDRYQRDGRSGLEEDSIRRILFQILHALTSLNENGIRHRCMSCSNVLLDETRNVKLSDFGLYEMTCGGSLVAFPLGELRYLSPEDISDSVSVKEHYSSPKSDVWALGVLLIEMVTGSCPFQPSTMDSKGLYNLLLQIIQFCGTELSIPLLEKQMDDLRHSDLELLRQRESGIAGHTTSASASKPEMFADIDFISSKMLHEDREAAHSVLSTRHTQTLAEWFRLPDFAHVSEDLKEFIEICLTIDPEKRPSPSQLLSHPYLSDLFSELARHQTWVPKPFARSLLLEKVHGEQSNISIVDSAAREGTETIARKPDKSSSSSRVSSPTMSATAMSISELFLFWKASNQLGLEHELAPQLQIAPPILRLPTLMRSQAIAESDIRLVLQQHGQKDESRKYDPSFVSVPVSQLRHIIAKNGRTIGQLAKTVDESDWSVEQKERDMAYQRRRVRLFKELLAEYPGSRSRILKEAQEDIPPSLRPQLWAAVLGVPTPIECKKLYDAIDKETEGPADRQIELDIPRCHQYHELLSSPLGHRRFKNILKAWVANNPSLSYWQGIDSLLAPYLSLNFDDEATAFACLQATIEKYSRNLFTKDNSVFFQEHLHTFKQLLLYHDPELGMHLHTIGFQPDLFAIPWFLTLFTHDFTIDQIYRLWDRVLVRDSQYPFFLSYSIMKQLRDILLPLDFNSCILLFSSLPSIDIDSFLHDADEAAQHTPPSVTMPNYVHDSVDVSRWWERRVSLEELQQELFPRLNVTDLVSSRFQFTVLDVRESQAFSSLRFPNSIRIDVDTVDIASIHRESEHIVVVGDRTHNAALFANKLVAHGFPRVSVLNGGIDALVEDAEPLLQRSEPLLVL